MPEPSDRRASERFPINADTTCTFAGAVVQDLGPVKIKNISMEGIGLVLTRKVETGALLAVTLTNGARSFQKTVVVRVAHVTPQIGAFLVGGTFASPLTYQELSTMVL